MSLKVSLSNVKLNSHPIKKRRHTDMIEESTAKWHAIIKEVIRTTQV